MCSRFFSGRNVGMDCRVKPGIQQLKYLHYFPSHHTSTTQWIFSFPVLRCPTLSAISLLGRLAFGQ
jgi:hypothetical protein